jgi:hypothetical protein
MHTSLISSSYPLISPVHFPHWTPPPCILPSLTLTKAPITILIIILLTLLIIKAKSYAITTVHTLFVSIAVLTTFAKFNGLTSYTAPTGLARAR